MGHVFDGFMAAARRGGRDLEAIARAGRPASVAAGARATGREVGMEEVQAHASRKLTDEETPRVAGGAGPAVARPWPGVYSSLAIFP